MPPSPLAYGVLSPETTSRYQDIGLFRDMDSPSEARTRQRLHTPRNPDGTPIDKPTRISKLIDLFYVDMVVDSFEDSDIEDYQTLRRTIETLKKREEKYIQDLDDLTIQRDDLQIHVDDLMDQISDMSTQLNDFQARMREVPSPSQLTSKNAEIHRLSCEVDDLRRDKDVLSSRLRTLTSSIGTSLAQAEQYKCEKDEATRLATEMMSRSVGSSQRVEYLLSENSKLKERLAATTRASNATQLTLMQKEKDLLECQTRINDLRGQLDEATKRRLQAEKRVYLLEECIGEKDREIEELRVQQEEAQKRMVAQESIGNRTSSDYQRNLRIKETEMGELMEAHRQVLEKKDIEITTLRNQLKMTSQRCEDYATQVASLKEATRQSSSEDISFPLKTGLSDFNTSQVSSREQVRPGAEDYAALEKEITLKTILLRKKDEDLDFYRSQLALRDMEIERLTEQLQEEAASGKKKGSRLMKASKRASTRLG
ncbi:Intracellular protein transport protein USO1 [Giardia muris]|uniref:Intracellular protein transport protein USO1 n=1 Tax=Giardia muris TaxID=5742 RepID=A0A4Z1SY96_GIAMU|nr:Intracellular protein transport protein USO1 [Giardia muris]|eukprot:TNJ30674.1 Intracellular protein transport protein USO1 [Giardia muris]